MQHLITELVNQIVKMTITERHMFSIKTSSYMSKVRKIRSRSDLFFKIFEFQLYGVFSYETCDKLICTAGEGISKQGSPKTYIKKISTSSTLGFGCYPHKDTCDIL